MVTAIPQQDNPLPGLAPPVVFAPQMTDAIKAFQNSQPRTQGNSQTIFTTTDAAQKNAVPFDAGTFLSTPLYEHKDAQKPIPDTVNMEQMLAQAQRVINAELQTIRNEMGQLNGNIDRAALSGHEGQLMNAQAEIGQMLEYLKSIREGRAMSIDGVFNPARALDNLQRLIVDKLKLGDTKTGIFVTNDHMNPPALVLQHLMMMTPLGMNLAIKHAALMQGIEVVSQVYNTVQNVQAVIEDFNLVVEHAKAAAAAAEEEQKSGKVRKALRKVFRRKTEGEKNLATVEEQIEEIIKEEEIIAAEERHAESGENVQSAEVKKAVVKEAEVAAKQRKENIVGKAKAVEEKRCSLLEVYDDILGAATEELDSATETYETVMTELEQNYHQVPVFEKAEDETPLKDRPVIDLSGDNPIEAVPNPATQKTKVTQVAGAVTCSMFKPIAVRGISSMLSGMRAQVAKASDSVAQKGIAGIGGKGDLVLLSDYMGKAVAAGQDISTKLQAQKNELGQKAETIELAQADLMLSAAREMGAEEKRVPLNTELLTDIYGAENAAKFAAEQQLAQAEAARELEPQKQSIMDKFHSALQTVVHGRSQAVQGLGL